LRHERLQWRIVGERRAAEETRQNRRGHDFARLILGPDFFQLAVILGTEKGEGRDDGSGADAGDDLEFGTVATLGPAAENASAKRAIGAAAGKGQRFYDRPAIDEV
jgi:hypothetical protein